MRFAGFLLAVIFVAGCGCAGRIPPQTPPTSRFVVAEWDPAYADVLSLVEPKTRECIREALVWRERMPSYRVLVEAVAAHRGADRLVIVERMPGRDIRNYWCGAVFESSRGTIAYSGGPLYAGDHEVGDPVPETQARGAAPLARLWPRLKAAGIWRNGTAVFDYASDNPAPWLIHVFGRSEGAVTFAVGGIALQDTEVVPGAVKGDAPVPRTAAEAGIEPFLAHDPQGAQGAEETRQLFESSYGARLALNGFLHALSEPSLRGE
jgi:hypothetical protein